MTCGIIEPVAMDPKIRDRIVRAGKRYAKAVAEADAARMELAYAALAGKDDDPATSNETIARLANTVSTTHIFRLIAWAREHPSPF